MNKVRRQEVKTYIRRLTKDFDNYLLSEDSGKRFRFKLEENTPYELACENTMFLTMTLIDNDRHLEITDNMTIGDITLPTLSYVKSMLNKRVSEFVSREYGNIRKQDLEEIIREKKNG